MEEQESNMMGVDDHVGKNEDNRVDNEAVGAWHTCPNCDQQYQNQHPLSRTGGDDDALSVVNVALRDEAVIRLKRLPCHSQRGSEKE